MKRQRLQHTVELPGQALRDLALVCQNKDDMFKEKFKVFKNVSKNFFVHFQEEYIPCIKCIKNKETVLASIGLIIEQSLVFWIKFDKLFPRTNFMDRDTPNTIYMCYICSIGTHIGSEDAEYLFEKTIAKDDGFRKVFFEFMQKIQFEFTLPCFNCSLQLTPQNKLAELIGARRLYCYFSLLFSERVEKFLDIVLYTFEYVLTNLRDQKKGLGFKDQLVIVEMMAHTIETGNLLKDL